MAIAIGIMGCGTVGTGVIKLLQKNASDISRKCGNELYIKKVLVKNLQKERQVNLPAEVFTLDPNEILEDPEIKIVVEVMGGIEPAKNYILRALQNGKNVVTANKDVLAAQGKELFQASEKHNVDLMFEASVAGGIPVILPLKESLAGNKIQQVLGIVNGTTNYILSKMDSEKMEFSEALAEAQALGYAEADPTADIEGLDAARKIAILASIAFQTRVTVNDVYVEGIKNITARDILYAKELGFVIKLLGIAREIEGEIEVRVHPVFLPVKHPLASVHDVYNAVYIEGDTVGQTMFYGPGAGEMPTASSVVGDLMAIARNISLQVTGKIAPCTCYKNKPFRPISEIVSCYYLRLIVEDEPGVLGSIAGILGDKTVSLASVIQKRTLGEAAEIVLITHRVKESYLNEALSAIRELAAVKNIDNIIRVEGR